MKIDKYTNNSTNIRKASVVRTCPKMQEMYDAIERKLICLEELIQQI